MESSKKILCISTAYFMRSSCCCCCCCYCSGMSTSNRKNFSSCNLCGKTSAFLSFIWWVRARFTTLHHYPLQSFTFFSQPVLYMLYIFSFANFSPTKFICNELHALWFRHIHELFVSYSNIVYVVARQTIWREANKPNKNEPNRIRKRKQKKIVLLRLHTKKGVHIVFHLILVRFQSVCGIHNNIKED